MYASDAREATKQALAQQPLNEFKEIMKEITYYIVNGHHVCEYAISHPVNITLLKSRGFKVTTTEGIHTISWETL
jgi:hypothetical protein